MAFDSDTRSRLAKMAAEARTLLRDEFTRQLQEIYGIQPDGKISDPDKLTHLDDEQRDAARLLRERITYLATGMAGEKKPLKAAVDRMTREQSFTLLNRFAALRMCEERGLVQQCVGGGMDSKGFQVYLKIAGSALGSQYDRYRTFVFSVFDEISVDLGILFDRFSPFGLLFPRETALIRLLDILNNEDLKHVWAEDEAIGWIYQYFNSAEERKAMRKASAAPRNSRELAVRNQFFTPRYVVAFLTDNTLGRIWYEMRQGDTELKEACRYLVRRPDEVFLDAASEEGKDNRNPGLKMLLEGTPETFPPFLNSDADISRVIQLAHAVNGYVRHPHEDTVDGEWWPWWKKREIQKQGSFEGVSTQDLLDILFAEARADRHGGGDGEAFRDEPILMEMANEIRRRALAAREEDLSQEELLNSPVFIPHRPLKDPRDIKMLDPACGSMHFGLYAFDLYEQIYEEAWDLEDSSGDHPFLRSAGLAPFHEIYDSREAFRRDVPRLIIEYNIHGIDIDPRAVQIAALALWLRAQRSWKQLGIKPGDRPRILKSNVVTAEPMPGDETMRREFVEGLRPRVLGQLVDVVFDKMALAGEAGSLLKIEEEIRDAIAEARDQWRKGPRHEQRNLFPDQARKRPVQQELRFDVKEVTDESFWEQAEERILDALKVYAEKAENGHAMRRRLFAEDAGRGFAFIDLCRKHFDVATMNPPFGDASLPSKPYIDDTYGDTRGDVYKAFVECFHDRLVPSGFLGIISSRTGFFLGQSEDWRTRVILRLFRPIVLADLGSGVLDAMVEVAAYVLRNISEQEARDLTLSFIPDLKTVQIDRQKRFSVPKWQAIRGGLKRHQALSELRNLKIGGFIKRFPGKVIQFTPISTKIKSVRPPSNKIFPSLICASVLSEENKSEALEKAILNTENGKIYVNDPSKFKIVTGSPFCYWVNNKIRLLFKRLPKFESNTRYARQGTVTGDDFRFLRLWWELPSEEIVQPTDHPESPKGPYCILFRKWVPFAKGGGYSPFYYDLHLSINWKHDGAEVRYFINPETGRTYSRPQNSDFFYRPGLTWPRRTNGLSFRVLPKGCGFGDKGPSVFVQGDDRSYLLAINAVVSSLLFSGLVSLQLARVELAQSFEVGLIQQTPFPSMEAKVKKQLCHLTKEAWNTKRSLVSTETASNAFILPALLRTSKISIVDRSAEWAGQLHRVEESINRIQNNNNDIAFHLYGIKDKECGGLILAPNNQPVPDSNAKIKKTENGTNSINTNFLLISLCDYIIGCTFGRWDFRFALDLSLSPNTPDPFSALPVCPPGMLVQPAGQPAKPNQIVSEEWLRARPDANTLPPEGSVKNPTIPDSEYPLRITWNGILVNDAIRENGASHPEDILLRIREVLDLLWKDKAHDIEQEACEILKVKSLRDYFTRPAGFFADHLKRYSKSRRKAPIYWPLSTESNSYTLWIYYHRLTDQTLYTCVTDFVDPKIKEVEKDIDQIQKDLQESADAKLRARFDSLTDFRQELIDFKTELLRVAQLPYKPNLNDGVLITASPLWKLFGHKPWQKDLKTCWEKLESGEFDWAHIAYTLWPDRVRDKCKTDRSLAIAHDLEALCETKKPKKRARQKKKKS